MLYTVYRDSIEWIKYAKETKASPHSVVSMLKSCFFLKLFLFWWSYICKSYWTWSYVQPQVNCSNNKASPLLDSLLDWLVPLSRCHLLQTSTFNLLALRPCGTRPSVPCRDPQSHRGGHEPHQGFPDRTSGSDHSEGAFVISTEKHIEFNVHNNENGI